VCLSQDSNCMKTGRFRFLHSVAPFGAERVASRSLPGSLRWILSWEPLQPQHFGANWPNPAMSRTGSRRLYATPSSTTVLLLPSAGVPVVRPSYDASADSSQSFSCSRCHPTGASRRSRATCTRLPLSSSAVPGSQEGAASLRSDTAPALPFRTTLHHRANSTVQTSPRWLVFSPSAANDFVALNLDSTSFPSSEIPTGLCKSLKTWSGRRDSNPRRPAWEDVTSTCLQRLSVSGASFRLSTSLAASAFCPFTSSNRGFFEVHPLGICTPFCTASHDSKLSVSPAPATAQSHGSPHPCLLLLHPLAFAGKFPSNTPVMSFARRMASWSSPSRSSSRPEPSS
jgi:hypothetical protein